MISLLLVDVCALNEDTHIDRVMPSNFSRQLLPRAGGRRQTSHGCQRFRRQALLGLAGFKQVGTVRHINVWWDAVVV